MGERSGLECGLVRSGELDASSRLHKSLEVAAAAPPPVLCSGAISAHAQHRETSTVPKRPISERRLAANRANAQKSTGPRTPEGKRRVSQNASRHNLYAGFHRLPEDIEDLLYRKALEETADIADPRFRALFVHRLMLRGHERRLLQLEGKLWAEALRVNNGIIPYASLWIRENHVEVVQALGRYHAWICVRIRAIQKSIFPYVIGDVEHQTVIPARTQALLASAAGSSRPITLVAYAGTPLNPDNQPTSIGPWNPDPSGHPDEASSADPAVSTNGNLPPTGVLSSLLTTRGGFRPVRPVPAPQAVKAIRPPTVPGLSLRFLNRSRKPSKPTKEESPTKNHDRKGLVPIHLRTATGKERATALQTPKSKPILNQPTTLGERTPSSAVGPLANHPSTPVPVPKRQRRASSGPCKQRGNRLGTIPTQLAQSTHREQINPTSVPQPDSSPEPIHRATPIPVPKRQRRAKPVSPKHRGDQQTATHSPQFTLPEQTNPTSVPQPDSSPEPIHPTTPVPVPERQRRAKPVSPKHRGDQQTATHSPHSALPEQTNPTRPVTLGLPLPST